MSAKFVLLKLCLNGIERWMPAKRSKDNRCKTSCSRSERKFLSSKIYFWTFKRPISVTLWLTFSRIWAQWSIDWLKSCLTAIERWLPAKIFQVQRWKTSYSRSERKYFWTCKWPISVKIYLIFPRTWAQYLFHWNHVSLTLSFDCRRKCRN